jgi:hypothetical protein
MQQRNQSIEELKEIVCCWDNIKMDLEDMGCGMVNLTVMTQDRAH